MASTEACVHIDAPMATVFQVLVDDRENLTNGNDEVRWRERLTEGPVRVGFSYKSTFVHERHKCSMYIRVTEFEQDRVIHEEYRHRCSVANRIVEGSMRYELIPHGDGSTLIAVSKRRVSGVAGFISGFLSKDCGLRGKLELIRSRAEVRHSPVLAETG